MIRKIITKEELEAKNTKNKRWMVIVIGLILLVSSASYAFFSFGGNNTSGKKPLTFSNVKFQQTDYGTWSFSYGGNSYETIFNPGDTINVTLYSSITGITNSISNYYQKPLYLGINSKEDVSSSGNLEILKNLGKIILKYQFSCLNQNCTEDYPVKNCSSDNVIIFKISETNSSYIKQNERCVTLAYSIGEEVKVADAFLFGLMGVKD